MFRVEFFCDDGQVGEALRRLMGIALQTPTCQPVTNAKLTRGGIKQETNGKLADLFEAYMDKKRPGSINVGFVREFLEKNGSSPSSGTYVIKSLIAAKRLKKAPGPAVGTKVRYNVLPKPEAKSAPKAKGH